MYCPKCGKNISDAARFCPGCGYQVKKDIVEEKKEIITEETKEINLDIIKEVEQTPNYNFNQKDKKNHNIIIVFIGIIVVLILVIVLMIVNNSKKSNITIDPRSNYCTENYEPSICGEKEVEEEEEITYFDSLDFTEFDFSEASSKQAFYDSVVEILSSKEEKGIKYCNDSNYTQATNNLNNTLNASYSYLCGMDLNYLTKLTSRLNQFYTQNNLKEQVVDSYVVGKGGRNEYANYTGQTIGSNSTYIAYLRRVHMSINMFSDYDKLTKSYERDLESGYHPANSIPEDIVVHETAHAIDFYISASRMGIESIVIDDFDKYNNLYSSWGEQLYSKEVVQKAVERVNKKYTTMGQQTKTELELREEISGYAASSKNGTIMYAETFAEALVDYLSNRMNAQDLSIEIYKIVQEDLANL